MKRKIVIWLLASVLSATVPLATAQQPGKVPRIGYVSLVGTASSDPSFAALREGLELIVMREELTAYLVDIVRATRQHIRRYRQADLFRRLEIDQ